MATEESVSMWLRYAQKLSEMINAGPGEAVQVTTPSTPWDWGGQTPPPGSLPYSLWSLLNVVPSNPQEQTNTNAAAGSSGFDHSYRVWMNALAVGNLEHDTHYKSLQASANEARRKYTTDYQAAQAQWKNTVPSGTPDFHTWLNDPAQFALLDQINNDKQDVLDKDQQLRDYVKQIEAPTKDILDAYDNPQYQATFSSAAGNVLERKWNLGTGSPYPIDYVMEITGSNFGGDATNGTASSLEINQDTAEYDYTEHYAEWGGATWLDFLAAGLAGNRKDVTAWGHSQGFTVKIDFQDVRTIPVRADGWYSGVDAFKDGPYATGFSKYKSGSDNYFFGAGGSLSRIYTGMVVAYRPKVTLTTWESYSSYLYSSWHDEGGLDFGPLDFGTEESGESTSAKVEQDGATLTLTSTANWPIILGMKSSWTVPPNE
ncbi:hypothetical protein [Nocardiopsis sp. NPDC006938]|uniref:hypothetical protein n=1 Tax=Nocardiopsis sp. NPDC006938 TaxID=3364337 RepID=UPI00368304BA